ncbi:FxSxx-COOH system tetratricopeptide repeat protein [Streptomyces sp. NPDC090106]|uniref:FxSxx-COOH system tetratricopeptide repeat protein n=1 Tax=Streptomyces sp. NPDC090106 TaxID=3365946 RepID=UPI00381FDE50
MSDNAELIFISHAGPDKEWAEWVAWHLQEAGFEVVLDRWHWRAGDDFVQKMSESLDKASAVVAVFSPHYFAPGRFTEEEWSAALARRGRLVPLVVEPLTTGLLPAILAPRLRKDLHGLSESDALTALLEAVRGPSLPTRPPAFPGAATVPTPAPAPHGPQPPFPAAAPRHRPAVWDVRGRRRNPHFTGRDGVIDELHTKLLAERHAAVQAVRGTGGIGKTLVALEYAYRYADEYDLVWWVDAEQSEQVATRYAELAERVGVAKPEAGVEVNARYAKEHLRTVGRWLIVLDNAEDPDQLAAWLPEDAGGGHVLITTRNAAWSRVVQGVSLGVFSRGESVAYLKGQLPTLTDEDADALADALGDLPLALAQAAGAMSQGIPADRYLRLLATNTARLLGHSAPHDYPASLAATVTIAARRLDADHPEAAALLRLAAFLGPEPIPTSWLETAHPDLTTIPGAPDDFLWPGSALTPLARYGLAVVRPDAFQVHRLTQAVVRQQDDGAPDATVEDVASLLATVHPGDPESPGNWAGWATLSPHLAAALPVLRDRAALRGVLLDSAHYLVRSAQSQTARVLAEHLYETWSSTLGKDDPDTLRAAHMVTWALDGLSAHAEALPLVEDVLERRRRVLGENHDETLSSANDLAVTLAVLGRMDTSHAMFQDIHTRRRNLLGDDHPETLRSAQRLATSHGTRGRWRESLRILTRVVERQRSLLGDDHPHTLQSRHSMGNSLQQLTRFDEAQPVIVDTLERMRHLLGEDHPDTIDVADTLCLVLLGHGRRAEAEQLAVETGRRALRVLGANHHHTLNTADTLSRVLLSLGRHAEAEQLSRDTRQRVRTALGEAHALYWQTTNTLSKVLEARGRKFEAQKLRASLRRKRDPGPRPR